jgi:hypothetical protein
MNGIRINRESLIREEEVVLNQDRNKLLVVEA